MSNAKLGEECCGDRMSANTTQLCGCGCGLTYCRICFHSHEMATRRAKLTTSSVIAFVKARAKGPCGCQYNMGSCSLPIYDWVTGKSLPGHYDRGPRTHYCICCQARAALDADGIEYEKNDQFNWDLTMTDYPGMKLDACAAPSMPPKGSETFVIGGPQRPNSEIRYK